MAETNLHETLTARLEAFARDLVIERAERGCELFSSILRRDGGLSRSDGALRVGGRPLAGAASRELVGLVADGTGLGCALFASDKALAQAGVLAEVSQLPRDLVSACQVRGESFAGLVEAGDRRFVVAARPLSVSSEVVGVLVCGVSASDANGTLMGLSSIESDILALASDAQTEKQRSVADFIKIIRGIAKRIHLLALNASILSAQAGEHGRGFAVVAREIGELAERTRQSTQELEADFLGQKREIVVERRQGGRQR